MKAYVQLQEASRARFARALQAVVDVARANGAGLLRKVMIYYAQSARKDTPVGKRQRPILKTPVREVRKGAPPYLMEKWYRNGQRKWLPIEGPNDSKRTIKKRGAAKASWVGMLRKLHNADVGEFEHLHNVLATGSAVRSQTTGKDNRWIISENMLGYIAKLRPGIARTAMAKAQNRLMGEYIKKYGDEIAQVWKAA